MSSNLRSCSTFRSKNKVYSVKENFTIVPLTPAEPPKHNAWTSSGLASLFSPEKREQKADKQKRERISGDSQGLPELQDSETELSPELQRNTLFSPEIQTPDTAPSPELAMPRPQRRLFDQTSMSAVVDKEVNGLDEDLEFASVSSDLSLVGSFARGVFISSELREPELAPPSQYYGPMFPMAPDWFVPYPVPYYGVYEEKKDEEAELRNKIRRQIDYYFSRGNLCKDLYLRRQFDSKTGAVPLSLVMSFGKMKRLGKNLELVKSVVRTQCLSHIELVGDGVRVEDWKYWKLPKSK